MVGPVLELQRTLYNTLNAELDTPVVDWLKEGAGYPYVRVGSVTVTPSVRHNDPSGRTVLATIHVWSRSRGFTQALQIAEQIDDVLDHACLDMPGWRVLSSQFVSLVTLLDPDPEIRHVPVSFRFRVEKTNE